MMKKSLLWRRAAQACAAGLGALVLSGCPNPNAIGVQQYGTVQVTCLQASNRQPVAGAIVELPGGSSQMVTQSTDASGNATLNQVVIGTHTAVADAPGLHGEATVTVVENQSVSVQVLMNPTQ
jgi:hypothetical protein